MTGQPTIQPAKTVEYETPRDLFDKLWDEVGGFDLDPCCRPEHYTAQRVLQADGLIMVPPDALEHGALPGFSEQEHPRFLVDGLAHPWHGRAAWMNPPYGPALRQWVPKAVHEVECGNAELVMGLLPAKTEVRWFQEYVMRGCRYSEGHERWTVGTPTAYLTEVRFLPGRLHFGGGDGPARVGNVLVVWRK